MKIEVNCEDKFIISKPFWKRTAALLDPTQVKKWADGQLAEGKMTAGDHDFYDTLYRSAESLMEDGPVMQWVKIGYIEDRRSKVRYPGQAVLVTKVIDGPMMAYLFTDGMKEDALESDPLVHDKNWKPGCGRRLFFGFYDPHGIYWKAKEIEEKERAYLAGRPVPRTQEENDFECMKRVFMNGSPF